MAVELVAQGLVAIELCAGFGAEGLARVKRAVNGQAVVTRAVRFDCHPGLGFRSGGKLFQSVTPQPASCDGGGLWCRYVRRRMMVATVETGSGDRMDGRQIARWSCPPCPALAPFIDRFWGWSSSGPATLPLLFPGTGSDVCFTIDNRYGMSPAPRFRWGI